MIFKGEVKSVNDKEVCIAFDSIVAQDYFKSKIDIPLSIEAKKWKDERTLAQNRLLWACIKDIARVTNGDNWTIYLEMLKRYGKFTYILVKPNAVDRFKREWREVEDLGEITTSNGDKAIQLRVYYGSHLLDVEEFIHLLNGVVEECKELGIKLPPSQEMKELLGVK